MTDFEYDIKECIKVLESGGTILYPTDTVWGIGCDALDYKAVDKVFQLKNRPANKSLVVLLADARDILTYVASPHPDIISIVESFEKPTTVIYDGALDFPDNVVSEDGSIAIRVTTDPFCKALIKRFRKPIVSTSANISGEPTAAIYKAISDSIKQKADYTVLYRRDDDTIAAPSRLVRIDDDGNITIIRA